MKEYLFEIQYLLGAERKKIPYLVVLFLISSFLDLVGIGLIGPYLALVVNADSPTEGSLQNIIVFMGLPQKQSQLLILLGLGLLVIFLLKAVFAIYINRIIIVFSNKQQIRLKSFLMQAYQHISYNDYIKRNSAEYILAIQSFTNSFAGVLNVGLRMISDGLVGLAILIMLAWTNGPALGLLVFLLGGMVFGYDRLLRKNIRKYGTLANEASTRMVQGIHEGIEGLKEIRILGREQHFHHIVHKGAQEASDNSVKSQVIASAPRYLLEFLLVVFVVSLVVGALLMGKNLKDLVPMFGMFGVASLRLMPSANNISTTLVQLRFNRHAISRLYNDLIELKEKKQSRTPASVPLKFVPTLKELTIRKICFSYPDIITPALNDLSLDISSGESIGLIGPSGSGKTTLVDVLLGLLQPQSGEIKYNGKQLNTSLAEWRSQVAYLPQQVFLIDNTLRNNIALGLIDEEINESRLQEALRQARLLEIVEQLPKGLDTILGERGVRLSGGQRQRVALSRAFYHQRSVLIMDEATSALDNETESEIVEEIKRLKGQKTIIVIAHRLTTVEHCDMIYCLENGSIIDSGTPERILKPRKYYNT